VSRSAVPSPARCRPRGMMQSVKTRKLDKPQPAGQNSVRIIGGSWRGRRVHFPDSPGLRPTPDRVRETLFNWLQHSIAGARCLDLFAGSGALGLEALSRGAREAVFVEQAFAPAHMLADELKRLYGGGTGRTTDGAGGRIVQMSAERFLNAPGEPFDVIFLDPPFGLDALPEYVRLIDAGGWVTRGGWVYLESPRSAGPPAIPSQWELIKSKSAGEVGYHLLRVNARA
jgi:16S rRNA (guanine966-N2)-methyltransferase